MITKSDLKIIKECLQAEGVRNSDFLEANKVTDKDNSYIAFIYEGKNYKIKVSNFEAIKSIIFNGNTITPDENGNVVITQKDAITLVKFYGPEFPIYTTLPEPNIKDGDYFYHTYSRQLMQWQNRGWHVVTLQPGLYFMLPDLSLWLYTEEQGLVRLLQDKQDLLISQVNIKTINGKSILGQGDLTITASLGSTIINYNGSQFLKIDDITDFSFPSSMVQDSIPEGGQILYDSVRHRFIYVVNGIMYTQWPLMEGIMASDAYATVDFVYKLGATVRIWKVTPNGLIDLVGTNEENLELVPFYAVKEEECPLVLEECSTEGVITYMQAYNVFALYKESNDTYYLLWAETQDRKGNGEYNFIDLSTTEAPYEKEEGDPVYTIRQDRLFYLEVNADDLIPVDTSLSEESMNPVANKAITLAFADQASSFNQSIGNINTILATLLDNSDLRLMLIDGLASSPIPWAFDINTYEGEDGRILVDPSRMKIILEVTSGNIVKYYNKWRKTDSRPSSDAFNFNKCVFAFILDGVLHIGVVRNNQFIEIGSSANITIDNSINPNSNNPVRNSAIYNRFEDVASNIANIVQILQNTNKTRLMPINGLVNNHSFTVIQLSYAGNGGSILIDEANARFILFVEGELALQGKGYLGWSATDTRYDFNEYDLNNLLFWYLDQNSKLHVGCYRNNQFIEIAGSGGNITIDNTIIANSENPVKNSAIYQALQLKQDVLVSGQNIKTLNGDSLLGEGELSMSAAIEVAYSGVSPSGRTSEWTSGDLYYSTIEGPLGGLFKYTDGEFVREELREGFFYNIIEEEDNSLEYSSPNFTKAPLIAEITNIVLSQTEPTVFWGQCSITEEQARQAVLEGRIVILQSADLGVASIMTMWPVPITSQYNYNSSILSNCFAVAPDYDGAICLYTISFDTTVGENVICAVSRRLDLGHYAEVKTLTGSYDAMFDVDAAKTQSGKMYLVTDSGGEKPYWAIKYFQTVNNTQVPMLKWVDATGQVAVR